MLICVERINIYLWKVPAWFRIDNPNENILEAFVRIIIINCDQYVIQELLFWYDSIIQIIKHV